MKPEERASENIGDQMERHQDPQDSLNSEKYHIGKTCINKDCYMPAGTAWGIYWCQRCNSKRLINIEKSLKEIISIFLVKKREVNHNANANKKGEKWYWRKSILSTI